ncbi:MAG TPA: hypothetical protein DCP28_37325 [Cytophagales bacterium]|nr:hypothetical protein [Cytophagales bacterium]
MSAQISIGSLPDTHSENFNSLAATGTSNTWTNGSTLSGWYARNAVNASNYTTYRAGDGSSPTTGMYSFGTAAGDRALGSLNQNASGDIAYGILFENNSGVTAQSVTIAFTAEQWRRVETNTKGFQRVTLSYQIGNSIDVTNTGLLSGSWTDIVEGFLIGGDSTTLAASEELNGNDAANRWAISVTLPISLPAGDQFFLRFYDDNVGDIDVAMAVDDFSITFSAATATRITATSDYGISTILDAGIIDDIPNDDDGIAYTEVTEADMTTLTNLFTDFYAGNYTDAATTAAGYTYELTQITANGSTYYLLRQGQGSTHYWGTYVRNTTASQDCLAIQAPHPKEDFRTGKQAVAVFDLPQASEFMVAGISRCTSGDGVQCSGSTTVCNGGPSGENFRTSDVAHNDSSAFHIASECLRSANTSLYFIQLHGFTQEMTDPEFIFSNGTENTPTTDYLVSLDTVFANTLPSLTVDLVHIDGATKLKGTTNTFGRVLNSYPNDICLSGTAPTTPSGRFLHLEQYKEFREYAENYDDLATIINTAIDCSMALPLRWLSFSSQSGPKEAIALTWTTSYEHEVSHFVVETSLDRQHFTPIGQVPSTNHPLGSTYQFEVATPIFGLHYYRLKAVDFDGSIWYSQVLPTNTTEAQPRLYPNPAKDRVRIEGHHEMEEVMLTSLQGATWTLPLEQGEVDLTGIPAGMYVISVGVERQLLRVE